jgi:protein-S-isoprenylcysteine O-methyltransferase Ste14
LAGQNGVIDRFRYGVAVLAIVCYPPGLLFWFLIHPFAASWRTVGPLATYCVVIPVLAVCGAVLFHVRSAMVGADFGTNWLGVGASAVCFVAMLALERAYRRHLTPAILVGVPELSGASSGAVLRDGIYGVIRHPRYVGAFLSAIACGLATNYGGVYIIALLVAPTLYIITLLEERELVDRFGDAYVRYQADVPRFIPRL